MQIIYRSYRIINSQIGRSCIIKANSKWIKGARYHNIASIFETYFIGIDRQSSSLISELDRYGGLKSAIQKLSVERNQLDRAITPLKNENQKLETYNQKMSSDLVYLNHKAFFLQGYIDALRNEIIGLSLTAAIIIYAFFEITYKIFKGWNFIITVGR
jgi:wobble nucleotide-excising tRNase